MQNELHLKLEALKEQLSNTLKVQLSKKDSDTVRLAKKELELILNINDPEFVIGLFQKHNKKNIVVPSWNNLDVTISLDCTYYDSFDLDIFEKIYAEPKLPTIFLGLGQWQKEEKPKLTLYYQNSNAVTYWDNLSDKQGLKRQRFTFLKNQNRSNFNLLINSSNLEIFESTLAGLDKGKIRLLKTQNSKGATLLHLAVTSSDLKKVECLLKHGAGITLFSKNSEGVTPLLLAFNKLAAMRSTNNAEKEIEIQIEICTTLLKEIIKNQNIIIPDDLSKNQHPISRADLATSNTMVAFPISSNVLFKIFKLQETGYIGNCELRLRQLLFSITKEQINFEQSISFDEKQNQSLVEWISDKEGTRLSEFEKFKALCLGLLQLFSSQKDLMKAGKNLESASTSFPEAYLLLGYQYITGQGQLYNYQTAGKYFFLTFTKAEEEYLETTDASQQAFLLKLQKTAIVQLETLHLSQKPAASTTEKHYVLSFLIKCYFKQKMFKEAAEKIKLLDISCFEPKDLAELNEIVAHVNYELAGTSKDNDEKSNYLLQACKVGHGGAALDLATSVINQPRSDFLEAANYYLAALTASYAANIKETVNQLLICINKLSNGADNLEKISELISKIAWIVIEKAKDNNDNWESYKELLKTLLTQKNLQEKNKMDIEFVLFSCYKNGRLVTEKELEITLTKKWGPITSKRSPEEIEAEKKEKIAEKFLSLKNKNYLPATFAYAICLEENYGIKRESNYDPEAHMINLYRRFMYIILTKISKDDPYRETELKKIQETAKAKAMNLYQQFVNTIKNDDKIFTMNFEHMVYSALEKEDLQERIDALKKLEFHEDEAIRSSYQQNYTKFTTNSEFMNTSIGQRFLEVKNWIANSKSEKSPIPNLNIAPQTTSTPSAPPEPGPSNLYPKLEDNVASQTVFIPSSFVEPTSNVSLHTSPGVPNFQEIQYPQPQPTTTVTKSFISDTNANLITPVQPNLEQPMFPEAPKIMLSESKPTNPLPKENPLEIIVPDTIEAELNSQSIENADFLKIDNEEQEIKAAEAALELARKNAEELQKKVNALRDKKSFKNLQEKNAQLVQKNQELEEKCTALEKQIVNLTDENYQLKAENELLHEEKKNDALTQAQKTIGKLNQQILNLKHPPTKFFNDKKQSKVADGKQIENTSQNDKKLRRSDSAASLDLTKVKL